MQPEEQRTDLNILVMENSAIVEDGVDMKLALAEGKKLSIEKLDLVLEGTD